MKRILILSCIASTLLAFGSCSSNVLNSEEKENKFVWEMSKLASENELDLYSARGDDDIVDWQLSKEFAELWMQESVEAGEYPEDSELWDIPVAVYDTEGNIKFYEFRVVSNNQVVAAIVGAANKSYGCPIVYESLCNGYADEITELYNSGKLSEDELPRIVDDGYPNVVFGVVNETKGGSIDFDSYLSKDGETVCEDDITFVLTYDEVCEKYPEYVSDGIDDEKMQSFIKSYKENGEAFWEMAVEMKGHIADFAVRGKAKSERTELDGGNIKNILDKDKNGKPTHICNYIACGSVAAGFVLDYIQANGFQVLTTWSSFDYYEKKDALYKTMNTGNGLVAGAVSLCGQDGGSVTMPANIGNAIWCYSGYKVSESSYAYPKESINNNLPGISLRLFGTGGCHYRPVIGYKKNGWWAFSWPSFKILDLVDCSDKINGSWESYIPVHHFKNWNVVKK